MRNVILALLIGSSAPAFGQTAADIARQTWPLAAPASSNTAPLATDGAGAFGPSDLARQLGVVATTGVAPRTNGASAQSFAGADLARLRDGAGVPALVEKAPPYRLARDEH